MNATELKAETKSFEYHGQDLDDMAFAPNYFRWILDEFRPFIGKNILEVGAGAGTFSKFVLDEINPESFIALEPASGNCDSLRQELAGCSGATVINGFLEDVPRQARPDTILYVNVLEHVPNDIAELDLAGQIISPGGRICIFVPALPFLFSRFDAKIGHFRRYSRKNLENVVRSAGLNILKSKYFDIPGILIWLIIFRLMKQESIRPGRANLYDSVAVPLIRSLEQRFPPPLGKNLLLVCEKPGK